MENNYLKQFERPESKFRGAPFWAWNCRLDKDTVLRQVDVFKEMGLSLIHIWYGTVYQKRPESASARKHA